MKSYDSVHQANEELSSLAKGQRVSIRGRIHQVTSHGLKVHGYKPPQRHTDGEQYNRTSTGRARCHTS